MSAMDGRRLDRRDFIGYLGAGAAIGLLSSCGRSLSASTDPSSSTTTDPILTSIRDGATVTQQAVRGPSIQAAPPPPAPQNWRPGQFITHVDVATRRMALTFDDGPSPYNTESVLRTLDAYGVRATFFLVGVNVRSWPDIAKRTHEAGHELGNHSVYHTPYQAAPLASQIGPNEAIIESATGYRPIANRAPGLTRGQVILDTCAAYGMYEVHTHMSTYDWISPRHSASALFDEFVRYHRNGAFAIYHDGGGRRPTPDALPSIISYGQSLGYEFVTATELVMSGIPQPGGVGDVTLSVTADSNPPPLIETNDAYVDVCNYDARAELEAVLENDPTITYAERMRIVDALADIDATMKQSDQP